jgi:hypothetical protein
MTDQSFHCPCCGAPGQLTQGVAEYGCTCRFAWQLVQQWIPAPFPYPYPYPYPPGPRMPQPWESPFTCRLEGGENVPRS